VTLAAYWQLIRGNRNFRRLWLAEIVSEMGDWFYAIAIYSLLLQLTGKAQSVGLALVLQVLPSTFAGPTAGVVNDRLRRKHVMIAADLARMVVVLGMILVRSAATVLLVYPLLFLETVMWAFFEPARSAVIPNVVGEEHVLIANTVSSITWSFNFAVGSALGGLVAVLLGRDAVFVLNALSFLCSALLIGGMRFHEPHAAEATPFRARELVDFSIFPIMGERVFPVHIAGLETSRGAVLGMSLLMGARGIGALIGPLSATRWAAGSGSRMRTGILAAFLAGAAGYMLLSRAPSLALACIPVALAHGGGSVVWVFSTTMLQRYSGDKFRGRVFAADLGFCTLVIAASGYLASVAIDWGVNVRMVALSTGVAMLFPALAWRWAMRLWRDDKPADESG
jgi:predicted MFS family arabinose efflux permease